MVSEVLENAEAILSKIVESGLEKSEVERLVREKQEEYGGLLTEAGAAYAIAKDRGIELGFEPRHEPTRIKDVKDGLEGIDIEGEVSQVFPVKKWEKENRKGRVGSVIVSDGSGETRVTLWNNDCDMIENGEIRRGSKIRVQNAAARGRDGMVELSVGYRSEVTVLERGNPDLTRLSEVSEGMNDVNFAARVERLYPVKEFERQGKKGRVLSMVVSDGTPMRMALWDSNADWEGKIGEGDTILVEGAYARSNRGKTELNLGWRGRLVQNPAGVDVSTAQRARVESLKPGETREIRAAVVKVYPPTIYEICSKCGKKHDGECCGPPKKAMVVNAELDDGTGVVRAVFFRELAEKLVGVSAEEFAKSGELDEKGILGRELCFTGSAKHNEMFNRDEMVIREFHDVEVEREIQMMKGE